MTEPQPPVYLYILMRNDLASMNAGKAVAQGTHAANQCVYEAHRAIKNGPEQSDLRVLLMEWEAETGVGFGTCICLGVNERQLRLKVEQAQRLGLHANITHDPSYPLRDGDSFHLIPLDTCGYVFGRKDALLGLLMSDLSLMP